MQFSEKFVRSLLNNVPDSFEFEDDMSCLKVRHLDHVITYDNVNKITGEFLHYAQFVTYKELFNIYTDYSLIYDGLSYPDSDLYYDLKQLV